VAESAAGARTVAVLPTGEQWPDGSLRPAIEDWLGAGAVLRCLEGSFSAEALAARATFEALRDRLESIVADSVSGRELAHHGFAEDVAIAVALDVSSAVPELRNGSYITAD
jgi:2-phosphosulfolactate phosphatase